ncbi:hypothetical protein [Allonocardiopsis opalescens]|nr:hypothetical protein [Allonocardiopsis opalescens]
MQPLGALVSVHPVANGRRWSAGLAVLLVVGTAVGLLALLIFNPGPGRGYGGLLAVMMIVLAVAVPAAWTQFAKAVRGGAAESFELYEGGVAHVARGVRRSWTWDQVFGVRAAEKGAGAVFGWDFGCAVSFRDGARVQFNGLTRGARTLAEAVVRHCPEAVGRTTEPEWLDDVLVWLLRLTPLFAIGFGAGLWWIASVFIADDARTDALSPGYAEGVQPLSDAAAGGLAALAIVCVVGCVLSVVAAVWWWIIEGGDG